MYRWSRWSPILTLDKYSINHDSSYDNPEHLFLRHLSFNFPDQDYNLMSGEIVSMLYGIGFLSFTQKLYLENRIWSLYLWIHRGSALFFIWLQMTRKEERWVYVTKFALEILDVLITNEATTSMQSMSVRQLYDAMPEQRRKSYSTIYRHLLNLTEKGYHVTLR